MVAADARNAALLRRSAALLDIDYWLRKLAPLLSIYQRDGVALTGINESIDFIRTESKKRQGRRIDFYELENRLPGNSCFPPSFAYNQEAQQSKLETHTQARPRAHYAARLFAKDGRVLTDHRLSHFWVS